MVEETVWLVSLPGHVSNCHYLGPVLGLLKPVILYTPHTSNKLETIPPSVLVHICHRGQNKNSKQCLSSGTLPPLTWKPARTERG